MRRVLSAAVTAVLATAAVAGAAPAKPFTFTDPRGDADFTGGSVPAASQAAFDVVRVQLTPHQRTRKTSSIAVRVDLAAPASTAVGTAFYVSGKQGDCGFTVARASTVDGWMNTYHLSCPATPARGAYHSDSLTAAPPVTGRTVTFVVPEAALDDARIGAKITNIEAGTAIADPAMGTATPAHVDVATHAGPYVIGR